MTAVARGDEHEDLSLPNVDGGAGAGEDGTSLLLLGRNLGLQDIEGQRILQVSLRGISVVNCAEKIFFNIWSCNYSVSF